MIKYVFMAFGCALLVPLILIQQDTPGNGPPPGGGFTTNLITINADYTAKVHDTIILVDASAGPVTITLPKANAKGLHLSIKKIDSSENAVLIKTQAGETIEGNANCSITVKFGWYSIVAAGNNMWVIM